MLDILSTQAYSAPSYTPVAPTPCSAAPVAPAQSAPASEPAPVLSASAPARSEQVEHAASRFSDFFAVSATSFSIYKDSSGQFITRFTNLKDGSVTYIPEPQMLQMGNPIPPDAKEMTQA